MDANPSPFELRVLTDKDFEAVFALENMAVEELGERYVPFSVQRLQEVLPQCKSIGAFRGEQLVAIRAVEAPTKLDPDILDALAVPAEDKDLIVNLCGVVVLPEYRRQGLARTMTLSVLDKMRDEGWKYAFATVSPTNLPSLKYLFSLGLVAGDIREMHGGKLRLLLFRSL